MIVVLVLEAAWIVVINSSVCPFLDEVEACATFLMGGIWLWGKLGLALVGGAQ